MGIQIVRTDSGEVISVRLKSLCCKTCFMTGASLILLIPMKNPNYLWLWDSTQRSIFLHKMCRKRCTWLLRYIIVFEKKVYEEGSVLPWDSVWHNSCIESTGIISITCWRKSKRLIGYKVFHSLYKVYHELYCWVVFSTGLEHVVTTLLKHK